jgi:hypothetical protein
MAGRGGPAMTPEERYERIDQKIGFIVNQQAQFQA